MRGHIEVVDRRLRPDDRAARPRRPRARSSPTRTAAVYVESPSYLGVIEADGAEIAELAHAAGAELIVGVDPISPRRARAAGRLGRRHRRRHRRSRSACT